MRTDEALRAALEQARQRLDPQKEPPFAFEMDLNHTGPIREGWHGGSFTFTLRLDRPSVGADDDVDD